jgi:F5/8 type C domain
MMRKQILSIPESDVPDTAPAMGSWLNLQDIASVELSSEDAQHPFEHALDQNGRDGWRASAPGPQIIKIAFDRPQSIRRIRLQFREEQMQRSQEFAIYVTSDAHSRKEVVRQQWNFSAGGSSVETEEYPVDFRGVSIFELEIDPGRHDREATASLQFIAIAA